MAETEHRWRPSWPNRKIINVLDRIDVVGIPVYKVSPDVPGKRQCTCCDKAVFPGHVCACSLVFPREKQVRIEDTLHNMIMKHPFKKIRILVEVLDEDADRDLSLWLLTGSGFHPQKEIEALLELGNNPWAKPEDKLDQYWHDVWEALHNQ